MTQTEFNLIFIKQVHRCEETLRGKAKEYTGNSPDRLSAFKTAAALQECTPERALAGMMAKHIISLYDMCFSEQSTYDQSMQDSRIYTFIILCSYFHPMIFYKIHAHKLIGSVFRFRIQLIKDIFLLLQPFAVYSFLAIFPSSYQNRHKKKPSIVFTVNDLS